MKFTFAYPNREPFFEKLNFDIDMNSRIAIVGPDGVGMSGILLNFNLISEFVLFE